MEREQTGTDMTGAGPIEETPESATIGEVRYERTPGATPSTNGDRPRGLLGRDALLKITRKPREPRRVDLPWLGEDAHVYVMPMTSREKDAFEKSLVKGKGKKRIVTEDNIRARIMVRCIVNQDGSRVLTDNDVNDMGNLDGQSADAIFLIAATESGITDEDVEEFAKN